jgi:hypothetical protein
MSLAVMSSTHSMACVSTLTSHGPAAGRGMGY